MAGLDLYAYDERNASWRWLATTNPFKATAGTPHVSSLEVVPATHQRGGAAGALTRYRLHLPLYNGVGNLSLGVGGVGAVLQPDDGAAARSERKRKPIVW